jgi:hypothetical protein
MLHNENYSKNGIYVKRQFECEIKRIDSASHIRFESHICLSYLEQSDETISTYAKEISNKRHRVYYIQRQTCTSQSSKVEYEWHLFLFLWSSSLIEGRFSVQ